MSIIKTILLNILILASIVSLHAEVAMGDDAPDFSLLDAQGSVKTLSDNTGKIVILEWHDPLCPYVSKFYKKGVLQELQEKYTKSKIASYMINSNAPGKQGYVNNKEANGENCPKSSISFIGIGYYKR